MSKRYMNRVFWDTFDQNFKPGAGKFVPKEYWMWDESASTIDLALKKRKQQRDRPYFTEEEEQILRLIAERKGKGQKMDAAGQLLTKEQEMINKKVKNIMIKAGLIPDDKQVAEELLA